MKKFLMGALIILSIAMSSNAIAQNVTREGNNFTATSTGRTSSKATQTEFTYTDTDGTTYPVFICTNGRCYIEKVSKKSGNMYKKYIPEDIAKTIAAELGIDYTYVKQPRK